MKRVPSSFVVLLTALCAARGAPAQVRPAGPEACQQPIAPPAGSWRDRANVMVATIAELALGSPPVISVLSHVPGDTREEKIRALEELYDNVEGASPGAKIATLAEVVQVLTQAGKPGPGAPPPKEGTGQKAFEFFKTHYDTIAAFAGDDGVITRRDIEPGLDAAGSALDTHVLAELKRTGKVVDLGEGAVNVGKTFVLQLGARKVYASKRAKQFATMQADLGPVMTALGVHPDTAPDTGARAFDGKAIATLARDAARTFPKKAPGAAPPSNLPVAFPDGIPIAALKPLTKNQIPTGVRIGVEQRPHGGVIVIRPR